MGRKAHPNQIKLQVPLNAQVYKDLQKRAADLGFDSAQAYIRFWAKAEASSNISREKANLRRHDVQALRYLELVLAFNKQEPASAQEALEYVLEQLKAIKLRKYLEQILKA